uniref:Fe2OG dioxygenase domain-containing protein n=1 Tax=Kalanchoe fedtschenkoi TaxID=63787 RepID=A0A7N0RBA0_KALFE
MGHFSPASGIPVVELGEKIISARSGSDWASKCDEVRRALEEYGCFIVESDKISTEFGDKIVKAYQDLFDLPVETKRRNSYPSEPFLGYFGQHPKVPLHESVGMQGTAFEAVQRVADLMWPDQGNVEFCETIYSLMKSMEDISYIVCRMVFESYNVTGLYEACHAQMNHATRLMKYRVPEPDETDLGLTPHVDTNFITVLYQGQTNGLEVQKKTGEWVTAGLSPSSFVFMAGEGLMAWSNGRISASHHQVTMGNTGKTRYSFAVFTSIKWTETPEELVDEDHPLKYKAYDHDEYMRYISKTGLEKDPLSLKAFCGVN